MPQTRRERNGSPLWLAAMAGLALAGCAGNQAAAPEAEPPSRPLAVEAPKQSGPAWAQGPAVDLQKLIDRAQPEAPPPELSAAANPATLLAAPTAPDEAMGPPAPTEELATQRLLTGNAPGANAAEPPQPSAPPAPEKSLDERVQDTALALTDLLNQQVGDPATAWKAYLGLAALDLIHPGSMPKMISPDAKGGTTLSPQEIATADTVRQFLSDLAAIPGDATATERSAKIAQIADRVVAAAPMRITNTTLCARVVGFGQYIPLGMDKFLQGRPQRAVVYVEVANFGYKQTSESPNSPLDRWQVHLSQTLQLFHDADGLLAWSRPEEEVIDESRNKRRDFYLVNEVNFPPTLTIGTYKLKIIMKDKISGQVDEAVIPFQVVADPALALQPGAQFP